MKFKPLLIVLAEPYSIFSEILFKSLKHKSIKKFKKKIILVGSKKLLEKQMLSLGYKFRFNEVTLHEMNNLQTYKNKIDKISTRSYYYIKNSFKTSLKLLKTYQFMGLVNGPISKKHFLNKKYLGITEYLS